MPEANIVVRDNFTHGNDLPGLSAPAGILVRRSDGGRYIGNRANRNGDYGIHLLDDGGNTLRQQRAHRERGREQRGRRLPRRGHGQLRIGKLVPDRSLLRPG